MTTKQREEFLSKETFVEVVQDHGGWQPFMYALYQKLVSVAHDMAKLASRVDHLEGGEITEATVNSWVAEAQDEDPPDGDAEQMLGERSPYGWHLLHPDCWSWDEVRRMRELIVGGAKAQGIFKTQPNVVINSVEWSIHRGKAFEAYRHWTWTQTGDPDARPAVAGLDPWSYLQGLVELAGPADDPTKYTNRFVEIHVGGGSR